MKITTQQIRQIISEELDKLLYEEEDNNNVLRKALIESISDEELNKYYEEIKQFIREHYQKIQDPETLQEFEQKVLPNLDNIDTLPSFFGQFRSFVYFDEESGEEKKALELESFLDAGEDKKSFIVDRMIEEKDFSGVNLSKANLSKANLSKANLSKTNLSKANLSGVNLSKANLSKANLRHANLTGANLSGAILNSTKMVNANLTKADLSGAKLTFTRIYPEKINMTGTTYDDNTEWGIAMFFIAYREKNLSKSEEETYLAKLGAKKV